MGNTARNVEHWEERVRALLAHSAEQLGASSWEFKTEPDSHSLRLYSNCVVPLHLGSRLMKNELLVRQLKACPTGKRIWILHCELNKEAGTPVLLIENGRVGVVSSGQPKQQEVKVEENEFSKWFKQLVGEDFPFSALASSLVPIGDGRWGTKNVRRDRLVGFPFVIYDESKQGEPYAVVAQGGYGVNSHAIYFTQSHGIDREILLRIPFGNFHDDPEREKKELIETLKKAARIAKKNRKAGKGYRIRFNMGSWTDMKPKPLLHPSGICGVRHAFLDFHKIGPKGEKQPIRFKLYSESGYRDCGRRLNIGRDLDEEIRLDDTNCSRRHAQIYSAHLGGNEEQVFYLRDLYSKNGTYVNGRRLKPNQPKPLKSGDRIVIGSTELLFGIYEAPTGGRKKKI